MSRLNGTFALGEYTLTFNVNTFCDLEESFKVDDVNGVLKIMQGMEEQPSLRTLRTIFHAALLGEHKDMTEREAGQIISEVGLEAAAEAMQNAVSAVFPESDGDVGNAPKKKAKAKAGK